MSIEQQFLKDLAAVFPDRPIEECHDIDDRDRFHIRENSQGRSDIVPTNNDESLPSFIIINSQAPKPIHFLALDKCFFSDSDSDAGKRSDCMVFNNQTLCFAELKLNVTSDNQNTRCDRAEEAMKQLGATIDFFQTKFKENSQDFMNLGFTYEAYIVFRSEKYPRDTSSRKNRKVKFAQQYGVKLEEKNIKEF